MKFSCLGNFCRISNRWISSFFAKKKKNRMFKKILEVGNLMSSYKDCLNLNRDEIEHIRGKEQTQIYGDTWLA